MKHKRLINKAAFRAKAADRCVLENAAFALLPGLEIFFGSFMLGLVYLYSLWHMKA